MNLTARRLTAAAATLALLAAILAANVLTARAGFVPVGFGLQATAGTFLAGAFLALRDVVHDTGGVRLVLVVVAAGAILSAVLATPALAAASAVAFLLAELADLIVYAPLRARSRLGDRRWTAAVVASNAVGAVVDSVVFLLIAFGTVAGTGGQLVGKGWATLVYLLAGLAVAAVLRHRRRAAAAA